jgi:hypothetical protein
MLSLRGAIKQRNSGPVMNHLPLAPAVGVGLVEQQENIMIKEGSKFFVFMFLATATS